MDKIWAGRFSKELNTLAKDFNSSLHIDSRLYKEDITGSIAHATMLGKQNIISQQDAASIVATLQQMIAELDCGSLEIDPSYEDIHSFVESELTKRIGDAGRRLHTARSRNDQVATDIRLYLRNEIKVISDLIVELLEALVDKADQHKETIMPGYTHLQRAQPIVFGHHLLAYAMMFMRDYARLQDASKRMSSMPLGAGALAGVTYDIDRQETAQLLGFDSIAINSLDAVSDRDFCIEIASTCSILMMHMSRLAEEIILWSSWEFRFVELDDAFTTGSSMMPQKKNSDMAELVRGKTGRVYGDLMGLLTMMKGLPLAYNKDMQEDKEAIFDCIDTVHQCLAVFAPMIASMQARPQEMRKAAAAGFINATDLADYLVKKGLPFRSAYKAVGEIVAECIANNITLEDMPISKYQEFSELFSDDLYDDIALENCVHKRSSLGGASTESVEYQISVVKNFISTNK